MLDRLIDEWPFTVGESPFHVSGSVYQVQKKAFAKRWKGGTREVIAVLREGDETCADFLEQTFLATRRYDVYPIVAVSRILSRALGQAHGDFLHEFAKRQMESDMGGIYRIILRLTSPMKIIEKLVEVDPRFFDFANTTIVERGQKSILLMKPGFPLLLTAWYDIIMETYAEVLMSRCGVKQYELSFDKKPNGERVETLELCDYYMATNWS